MADLKVDFCGLEFKNLIVVSSIEPTNSLANLKKCIEAGAAGAIVKTLTDIPAMHSLTQHSKYAILNEEGRCIKGKAPPALHLLQPLRLCQGGLSGTGRMAQGGPSLCRPKRYPHHRQYRRRLNGRVTKYRPRGGGLRCAHAGAEPGFPHPTQMKGARAGVLICQDPQASAEVVAAVKAVVDIPIMVKLSPMADNLMVIAQSVQQAGAEAVTVNGRFTGFCVDITTGQPYIGGPAGVGGPWVKPITLRWVHDIHSKLGMPIAGSNGIYDWRDAIEFIMSGANIMQVGSVLMLKGHEWVGKIIAGIDRFLDEQGYAGVAEIHGLASRRAAASYEQTFGEKGKHAVIDPEKCTLCWNCVRSCFYGAMEKSKDQVLTLTENCIGCELCYNVCPFDAVSFEANP